jgi:isopenicillin N synthase-like dioxygenase
MQHSSIPHIDLAPFTKGLEKDKLRIAMEVNQTCEDIGFFTVTGHGVTPDLIKHMHAVAAQFFDLPVAEKLKLKTGSGHGYIPPQCENLAATRNIASPADLKESFNVTSCTEQNVWPAVSTSLQPACIAYFQAMESLAGILMRVFALALNMPEDFFDDKIQPPHAVLRLLNYPAQLQDPSPGQLRAGEHSDYGTLTIISGDDAPGGLQVFTRHGTWVDVITEPGTFVVNIGDMMQRWTNDRWVSTLHRVINPPVQQRHQSRRQSIVFFHNPNDETMITCLDSCCSTERPAQYAPIRAVDHRRLKSQKSRQTTGSC